MVGTTHIVLAMKPVQGNFVENALKHGVAGINIGATRIAGPAWKWGTQTDLRGGGFGSRKPSDGSVMARDVESNPAGRWPANVVLGHSEGCVSKGVRKVKSDGHHSYKLPEDGGLYELGLKDLEDKGNPYAGEDGKEEVEDWECVEGCPVRAIGEQSGDLKSGKMKGSYVGFGTTGIFGSSGESERETYGDKGTAARFFKQISELKGEKYDRDDEAGRVS
jgi:hypothetical protein